jgi:hypothetical protein
MFEPQNLRDRLNEEPFKPFRLCLADGSAHEVAHPELAWVIGERVFVARHRGGVNPNDYSVKELSIFHLTRIEESRDQAA